MMQVMLERPSLPRSDEGPSAGPHTATVREPAGTVREPAGIYSELAVRMSASIWPRSSNALSGGRRVVAQAQRSRHEPLIVEDCPHLRAGALVGSWCAAPGIGAG